MNHEPSAPDSPASPADDDAPVYLDHMATTPCDPRVVEALLPWLTERFGNPSSATHRWGREARHAVETARVEVATLVGASPKEIVFTSGTTEGVNTALWGLARARRAGRDRIVVSAVEHHAVLDTATAVAAAHGLTVDVLPVDGAGRVDPAAVRAALAGDDVLCVALMAANNEVGTLQPVAEVGALCREAEVALVCDAAQQVGKLPFDVGAARVDVAAFSAHKLYGPKGIGALYVRRRPPLRMDALVHGGGQERGMRSGTLNVPGIVGFGAACRLAGEAMADEAARVGALRDALWAGLVAAVPDARLNGAALGGGERLPHNLHVAFPGVEARALMERLPDIGVSSGSACASATLEVSHVLTAMGLPAHLAYSSVRFGLGRGTTAGQVARVVREVAAAVGALRAAPR